MNLRRLLSVMGAVIILVSSNLKTQAGCDEIADKNLQVAGGMSTEQIRELIQSAVVTNKKIEQASIKQNK